MAFTVRFSDGFGRPNGDLNGSTLDLAGGGTGAHTWTTKSGAWSVVSGRGGATGSGDQGLVVDSAMDAAAQRVSARIYGNDCGLVARFGADGRFYIVYRNTSNLLRLFYREGGSFYVIGPLGTTTVNDGDIVSIECVGSVLRSLINGVEETTGIDANLFSGKPGLYGGGTAAGLVDDFVYETDEGSSSTVPSIFMTHHITQGMA